jgi:hypothetical protein
MVLTPDEAATLNDRQHEEQYNHYVTFLDAELAKRWYTDCPNVDIDIEGEMHIKVHLRLREEYTQAGWHIEVHKNEESEATWAFRRYE